MFMTRSLNVTPKTTEQHLIARSAKSAAYVTNNKRKCQNYLFGPNCIVNGPISYKITPKCFSPVSLSLGGQGQSQGQGQER